MTRNEVLTAVRGGEVDVVLLDIQMPELSGLEALQLFPAGGPLVIFCTAHAAHAVSAFDVGAVDYVLKPIDGGRLRKALDRARQRLVTASPDAAALPVGARGRWIAWPCRRGTGSCWSTRATSPTRSSPTSS